MDHSCTHTHAPPDRAAGEVGAALARAEGRSVAEGHRWTEPRRRVYELLLRAGAPVKAYDLMAIYAEGRVAKPPTVYRALEFLEQVGLVHRIGGLNAFVACDGSEASHTAAFLICDCCGSAEEFEPGQVRSAAIAASERGFATRAVSLEVRGRCHSCTAD